MELNRLFWLQKIEKDEVSHLTPEEQHSLRVALGKWSDELYWILEEYGI